MVTTCFEPISYGLRLPQENHRAYEKITLNSPNSPNTSNIVTPLITFFAHQIARVRKFTRF
jgi:hypothetical protein